MLEDTFKLEGYTPGMYHDLGNMLEDTFKLEGYTPQGLSFP